MNLANDITNVDQQVLALETELKALYQPPGPGDYLECLAVMALGFSFILIVLFILNLID
jgi:hypothetical protein